MIWITNYNITCLPPFADVLFKNLANVNDSLDLTWLYLRRTIILGKNSFYIFFISFGIQTLDFSRQISCQTKSPHTKNLRNLRIKVLAGLMDLLGSKYQGIEVFKPLFEKQLKWRRSEIHINTKCINVMQKTININYEIKWNHRIIATLLNSVAKPLGTEWSTCIRTYIRHSPKSTK